MTKFYLFTSFLVISTLLVGQGVEIYSQNLNVTAKKNAITFSYIDTGFIPLEENYIATLTGHATHTGKVTLENLYNSFWYKSNQLGANAYSIEEVTNKLDTTFLMISIYNLNTAQLERNFDLYPNNMVYVIGDLDKSKMPKKVKVNKEKISLKPLEFIAYQNKVGEEATVSIGGLLGTKVWIKGKVNRSPKHLSLRGFGVGPMVPNYNQLGISFNTGRIYPVDLDFGQFLVNVLTENKE